MELMNKKDAGSLTNLRRRGRGGGGGGEEEEEQKVKLALCLNKHPAMKAYGEAEIHVRAFITSVLNVDEWSASCSGCLTPRKELPVPIGQ